MTTKIQSIELVIMPYRRRKSKNTMIVKKRKVSCRKNSVSNLFWACHSLISPCRAYVSLGPPRDARLFSEIISFEESLSDVLRLNNTPYVKALLLAPSVEFKVVRKLLLSAAFIVCVIVLESIVEPVVPSELTVAESTAGNA